jgi:hypothetical protein
MNQEVCNSIETSISAHRLSTYLNHSSVGTKKIAIANYVLNAKIAENFYFLLQNLEVSLRNAIYDGFKKHYSTSDFFYTSSTNSRDRYLERREKHSRECWKMLCGAKYKLRHLTHITDGKIIAELNFGFWTELLLSRNSKYTNMWRRIFTDVFPYYDIRRSIDADKVIIATLLNSTRKFRNRIFHYEPIFNLPNLEDIHKDIIVVLGWINKDMQALSILFDSFKSIQLEKQFITKQLKDKTLAGKKNRRKRFKITSK